MTATQGTQQRLAQRACARHRGRLDAAVRAAQFWSRGFFDDRMRCVLFQPLAQRQETHPFEGSGASRCTEEPDDGAGGGDGFPGACIGALEVRRRLVSLAARVDIGEVFNDRRVPHETPREDIPEGVSILNPDIILEVNDRTINVYMRARIPAKSLRTPGNPHSNFRKDLVLSWSRMY